MSQSIDEKIAYLRDCCQKYETTGKSPISDAEYDRLYAEAKEEDPNNSFFDEAGATLDEQHLYGKKISHKVIMGSLNKCASVEAFLAWMKSTYPKENYLEFVVQYKIDGLSLGCSYSKGQLQYVATRGNSVEGVDVTKNAKFVHGIPETIKCQDDVEIRGECFKDRSDFYKNWVGEYENPRSFCAGAINQLDPQITKDRGLSFVSYEIVRKDFKKEVDKIKFLSDNGFETLEKSTKMARGSSEEIAEKMKKHMDSIKRDELPYSIDGVVVKVNDISIKNELGYVNDGKRPKSNVAVKFPCEQVSTEIKEIEWSVGKTGKIVPVAILSPIRLNETTVKRVTLHNIKFIKEMDLKIGSVILIQKSGEIIPYCVRKMSDKKDSVAISIPNNCPDCKEPLVWDSTDTTKVCNNPNCSAQLLGKIDSYFKTIGAKGIGEGIISRLISECKNGCDKYMVTCISDMYELFPNYRSEMAEAFGDRASEKIKESIESVKEISLAKFLEALSIANIGRMAKEITAKAPTVKDVDNLKEEDIVNIAGFGPVKSKNFIEGWSAQRSEIEKLLKHIKITEVKLSSSKLSGKSFCVTGTLSQPRDSIHAIIESNGGKVSSSVSSKLSYLICGEEAGSKKEKAEKLGITVISEHDLEKMIK